MEMPKWHNKSFLNILYLQEFVTKKGWNTMTPVTSTETSNDRIALWGCPVALIAIYDLEESSKLVSSFLTVLIWAPVSTKKVNLRLSPVRVMKKKSLIHNVRPLSQKSLLHPSMTLWRCRRWRWELESSRECKRRGGSQVVVWAVF